MRSFSNEEFNMMISELIDEKHSSYDLLCSIADRTLRPTVKHWCAMEPALSGRNFEDDIMQDIFCRLIKTCVTFFLKKDNCGKFVNRDPDDFKSWMFKVAENIKRDTANTLRRRNFNVRGFEDGEVEQLPDCTEDEETILYRQEKLARAFELVLNSDAKIYKVLTWLAQSLFIIQYDISKIESNHEIIKEFSEKSLFEMRDIIFQVAHYVPWLSISQSQIDKINCALNTVFRDNKPIGEMRYKDFFMKKGGKATISDWVNRMNNMIERLMKVETLRFKTHSERGGAQN